jgi:crotonobetainyl-CoA:carnitine CoA-transferase CaiB-like acyl-CoA transferase
MPGYAFLDGLLVIEVAQLGMDALGGYLADMGARVVKVEAPGQGDPVRFAGEDAVGGPDGVGFLHLRWNRGKQSIAIDLRAREGADLFRRLAARADVVVDGLKGGSLERLGLGYESLRADHPALVYCSLSGLGLDGPYHQLRSHAVAYDAFAGLIDPAADRRPPPRGAFRPPSIGMNAPGLYAAVGVLSAVIQAQRSGAGAFIEVAAADVAANWTPDGLDPVVNRAVCAQRPGFLGADGRMAGWARLAPYATADGRTILLEALSLATWRKFCAVVERPDLLALTPEALGHEDDDAAVERELEALFRTRTLEAWMALLSAHDVSAMPVNRLADLPQDPQYAARANWYDVELEGGDALRLSGTPVRVRDAPFAPQLAPLLGQDTDRVLGDVLGLKAEEIARLRGSDVVA